MGFGFAKGSGCWEDCRWEHGDASQGVDVIVKPPGLKRPGICTSSHWPGRNYCIASFSICSVDTKFEGREEVSQRGGGAGLEGALGEGKILAARGENTVICPLSGISSRRRRILGLTCSIRDRTT